MEEKITQLEAKINAIYESVEKTRKYLFWTFVLTLVFFVLPLIAAVFLIPPFISQYLSTFSSLGL